jgi:pSer/pThr/pTyr-binding forkhead associated (FHA) protein
MNSPSEDAHATLECTSEPGVTLAVKSGQVIGREGDVDVSTLSDAKYMSRKHARFKVHRDKWFIENLSTKSFTYVNGKQVEPNTEVEIKSGDRLTFGIIRCTFNTPG